MRRTTFGRARTRATTVFATIALGGAGVYAALLTASLLPGGPALAQGPRALILGGHVPGGHGLAYQAYDGEPGLFACRFLRTRPYGVGYGSPCSATGMGTPSTPSPSPWTPSAGGGAGCGRCPPGAGNDCRPSPRPARHTGRAGHTPHRRPADRGVLRIASRTPPRRGTRHGTRHPPRGGRATAPHTPGRGGTHDTPETGWAFLRPARTGHPRPAPIRRCGGTVRAGEAARHRPSPPARQHPRTTHTPTPGIPGRGRPATDPETRGSGPDMRTLSSVLITLLLSPRLVPPGC